MEKSLRGILKESPLKKLNLLKGKIHCGHKKTSYSNRNMEIYSAQDFGFRQKKFLGHPGRKMNHFKSVRKSG